ncbi:MAG: hypothetical protein L3K08_07420 [Thermoplasmata archaeon]|nr:hypothetical protein [Thermoplasmata archaeon]
MIGSAPDTFGSIPLPAPVTRRMRLGPFPSARDALKFLAYAALGAFLAGFLGPIAWVPFLGGGFLLSTYKENGEGFDERFVQYLHWRWRSRAGRSYPGIGGRVKARGGQARIAGDRWVGIVAARGTPVVFLPPDEARRLFERYVDLLRALDPGAVLRAFVEPLSPRRFLPRPPAAGHDAAPKARSGYSEMVRLLCRRRNRRIVHVLLWSGIGADAGPTRLEERLDSVQRGLDAMGIEARRVRGPELVSALRDLGWPATEVP